MKRKVIKQGAATLTMSLPASWIKHFGIKPGDELEVNELNNDLVISTKRIVPEAKIEVDISGLSDSLVWSHLNMLYVRGTDEIKLIIDKEKIGLLQRIVDSLIGFAIVEQKGNECVIKSVSKVEKEQFENMFKRIFFILQSMASDSLEAFKKQDKKGLVAVKETDYGVNKIVFYCMRILNKEGYTEAKKTPVIYDVIDLLELLGDEYADLSSKLIEIKPSNELIKIYKRLNESLGKIYFLFFKFNKTELKDMHEKNKALGKEIKKLIELKQKKEALALVHMQKISELLKSFLESVLAISL